MRKTLLSCILGAGVGFGVGCGPAADHPAGNAPVAVDTGARSQVDPPVFSQHPLPSAGSEAKRMEFLNRIRQSDPRYNTIQKALLNDKNELGLILSRNVEMAEVPKLMRGMLTQMASEFPGQDLTIVAYAPANPPIKVGTARLNARTRDMTYTPTKH